MHNTSYIELKKSALKNNINFLKRYLGKDVRISSVIKGNAYGHGITEFVPLVEECGVSHFSTFSAWEAKKALKVSRGSTIMIMGYIDDSELEWAIENGIEFYVFNTERLKEAVNIARKTGTRARIHIDVETGMNRTGIEEAEIAEVIKTLKSNPENIEFSGLCTHYAGAESIANYVRVKEQVQRYKEILKSFQNAGVSPRIRHTASSAAAIAYPETRMGLVRIGIMQYGFWPSMETYIYYLSKNDVKTNPLKRIITWKSCVMDIKDVKRGEFIGYNTSYLASSDMRIAIVPVGYSDGYSRSLSNHGRVLINGCRAGVIGLVSMNMMIVNVSRIPNVKKGDEVVLIGTQKNRSISVSSFSKFTTHDVNYELLTRLSEHIPRFVRP